MVDALPKIGRNERIAVKAVKTGKIFEAKFKKVEDGLRVSAIPSFFEINESAEV